MYFFNTTVAFSFLFTIAPMTWRGQWEGVPKDYRDQKCREDIWRWLPAEKTWKAQLKLFSALHKAHRPACWLYHQALFFCHLHVKSHIKYGELTFQRTKEKWHIISILLPTKIPPKQRKWPILVTVSRVTRRNVALAKIECRAMGTPHARRSMKNFPIAFAAKIKKKKAKKRSI